MAKIFIIVKDKKLGNIRQFEVESKNKSSAIRKFRKTHSTKRFKIIETNTKLKFP